MILMTPDFSHQLTAARIRGAQVVAQTHKKSIDRFEGVVPMIEDWHCQPRLALSVDSHEGMTIFTKAMLQVYLTCYTGDLGPIVQPKFFQRERNIISFA